MKGSLHLLASPRRRRRLALAADRRAARVYETTLPKTLPPLPVRRG